MEKELGEVAKLESEPKRAGNIISAIFIGK